MSAQIIETIWADADSTLSTNNIRAVILCDTAADLPAINAFADFTLMQGSKAHVIDDDENKMLDSSGTWHTYANPLGGI